MVTISLEWMTARWLLQGLVTSLLSGVGFLFITMALDYVKKYCRDKKQREKALILQKILRGEEIMQWTSDKALVLVPKERNLGRGDRLSKASMLFNNYKKKGGFLGVGLGYYGNQFRDAICESEVDLEKFRTEILDFPEWSNLNLESVKPPSQGELGIGNNVSFTRTKDYSPTASSSVTMQQGDAGPNDPRMFRMPGDYTGPKLWSQQQQPQSGGGDHKKNTGLPLSKKVCEDMCRKLVNDYPFIAPYLKRDVIDEIDAKIAADSKDTCETVTDSPKASPCSSKGSFRKPFRSTTRKKPLGNTKNGSAAENTHDRDNGKSPGGSSVDDVKYINGSLKNTRIPGLPPVVLSQKKGGNNVNVPKSISKTSKSEPRIVKKNLGSRSHLTINDIGQTITSSKASKRSRSASVGRRGLRKNVDKKLSGEGHSKSPVKEEAMRGSVKNVDKKLPGEVHWKSPVKEEPMRGSEKNIDKKLPGEAHSKSSVKVEPKKGSGKDVDKKLSGEAHSKSPVKEEPKRGSGKNIDRKLPGEGHSKSSVKEEPARPKETMPSVIQPDIREFGSSVDDYSVTVLAKKPNMAKSQIDVGFIVDDKPESLTQYKTDICKESSDILLAFEKAVKVNTLEEISKCVTDSTTFEDKKSKGVSFFNPDPSTSPSKARKKTLNDVKAKQLKKKLNTQPDKHETDGDQPIHPLPQPPSGATVKRGYLPRKQKPPVLESKASRYSPKQEKTGERSPQKVRKADRQMVTTQKPVLSQVKRKSSNPPLPHVSSLRPIAPKEGSTGGMSKGAGSEKQTGRKRLSTSSPEKISSKNKDPKQHGRSVKTTEKSPKSRAQQERRTDKKKDRKDRNKGPKHLDSSSSCLSFSKSEGSPGLKQKQRSKFSKGRREGQHRSDSDNSSVGLPLPSSSDPRRMKRKTASKRMPKNWQSPNRPTPKNRAVKKMKGETIAQQKAKKKHSKLHGEQDSLTTLKSSVVPSKSRKGHGTHSLRESKDLIMNNEPEDTDSDDDSQDEQEGSVNVSEGMRTISDYQVKVSQRRLWDTIGPIVTYHPKKKPKNTKKTDTGKKQLYGAESQDQSSGLSETGTRSPESPQMARMEGGEMRARTRSRSTTRRSIPLNIGCADTGNIDSFKHKDLDTQSTDEIHIKVLPAVDTSKNAHGYCKEHIKPAPEPQLPPLTAEKAMEISTASTRTSNSRCGSRLNPSGDSKSSSRAATCSGTGSLCTLSSRRSTPLEDITECLTGSITSSSSSDSCDLVVLSKCDLQPTASHEPSGPKKRTRSKHSPRSYSRQDAVMTPSAVTRNNRSNKMAGDHSQSSPVVLKKSALDDVVRSIHRSPTHRITPSPTLPKPGENQGYSGFRLSSPFRDEVTANLPHEAGMTSSSRPSLYLASSVRGSPGLDLRCNNVSSWDSDCGNVESLTSSHHSSLHPLESWTSSQHRGQLAGSKHTSFSSLRNPDLVSPISRGLTGSRADTPARSLFGSRASFQVESFESASANGNQDSFQQSYNMRKDSWDYKGKPFQEYRVRHQPHDVD